MRISLKLAVALSAFAGLTVICSVVAWFWWNDPVHQANANPPILVLEKELQLIKFSQAYIWAPDNRHMLVAGSWDGKLRIIDTESDDAEGRVIDNDVGATPSLAWSPNGNLIAVSIPQDGQNKTIRIWSVKSGKLIISLSNQNINYFHGCSFGNNPLTFSLDNKALWLSCERLYHKNNTQNHIVAAVKLEIDSVALRKIVRIDNLHSGRPFFISGQTFSNQDGALKFCFVLGSGLITTI